jgi:hypothetical protein
MASLQSIFRRYGESFREKHALWSHKTKVMGAIQACRTSLLGAHIDSCDECGHVEISYNSCKNRHCPRCQTFAKEKWILERSRDLLDIGYFHLVFTVPSELRTLMYQNQDVLYNLLFKAASETILELCKEAKYLGGLPGITCVLHTWGQDLSYHPHLHCIVSGGGMSDKGFWRRSKKKFFLPVRVLSRKFRGKYLALIKKAALDFYGSQDFLKDPLAFERTLGVLYAKEWVVYCKEPFGDAGKVVSYLGRYTHRVAISDGRILDDSDGKVSFEWRDYADNNRMKVMTLDCEEFIRRFLMHVLPPGFRKIRHFGIMAPRNKTARLRRLRILTCTKEPGPRPTTEDILDKMCGPSWRFCRACGLEKPARASP